MINVEKEERILYLKNLSSEVIKLIKSKENIALHEVDFFTELLNKELKFIIDNLTIKELKKIETKELVNELRNREGVEIKIIDPYENYVLEVSGPMIVIKVID
jgi:primosomal protein N''